MNRPCGCLKGSGAVGRCGLVGGNVSVSVGLEVSLAQATPSDSVYFLLVEDQHVAPPSPAPCLSEDCHAP